MFKTMTTAASAGAILALAGMASVHAGRGGVPDQIRVEARMELGTDLAQARARYRDRFRNGLLEQRFDVEAEDFKPGAELAVTVNGIAVGSMFVNDLGVAEMQLRTAEFIDDPGDGTPIDPDFPRLMVGDTVSVGPLKGVFQAD